MISAFEWYMDEFIAILRLIYEVSLQTRRSKVAVTEMGLNCCEIMLLVWRAALGCIHVYKH